MDFEDSAGTRYQLTETAEAPPPAKKPVWPWVVGGLALAGGLVWMASSTSRKANPIAPEIEALIEEARDPSTDFSRLVELFKHPEVEVRRALLDNPNVCPTQADGKIKAELLEELVEEFPKEVATHPLFVLHALIEPNDEFQGVVGAVVERTADVGLIEHLFRMWGSSYWRVRRSVVKNPRTPEDLLRTLGNQETESVWAVRWTVAQNPNTPVESLRILGDEQTESEWKVREVVALNPSTPEDTLRLLGNEQTESKWEVRQAVAHNHHTTVDTLRTLGNEVTESYWRVREAVAKNPSTPEDVLRTLGNEQTESLMYVRASVASNPNTPVGVLRILGNQETESVWGVREAVAKNPSTPVDTLHTLGSEQTESNKFVREAAQNALAARGLT